MVMTTGKGQDIQYDPRIQNQPHFVFVATLQHGPQNIQVGLDGLVSVLLVLQLVDDFIEIE